MSSAIKHADMPTRHPEVGPVTPVVVASIVDENGKIVKLASEWTIIHGTTLEFVSAPAVAFGPVTYQVRIG